MTNATKTQKIVRIGNTPSHTGRPVPVYIKIELENTQKGATLSITGVEGPYPSGNCAGSAGQIVTGMDAAYLDALDIAPGWTRPDIERLLEIWNRWHLNDMNAACEHQRAAGWTRPDNYLEIVHYRLTREARETLKNALEIARVAAINGEVAELTDTERALIELESEYRPTYQPPDADSPLSGCYEVGKRESKLAGWTYEHEHPAGILSKPCPECGYQYGSAWLYEEIPADIIAWLFALPDTDTTPAWI